MNKRLSPLFILFISTSFISALTFYLLWSEICTIDENDSLAVIPIDKVQILVFLAKPLLLLAPFLLILTIIGAYLLSKIWLKDVVINIINETYGKKFVIDKMKHLSEEEKEVLKILIKYKTEVLQSDIVKETGLSPYKITRILNRFEHSELIRRKEYGITNIVFILFDPESQNVV